MEKVLANGLLALRRSNIGTDVTIKSRNLQIAAHKNVLAGASKYFERLFFGSGFADIGNVVDMTRYGDKEVEVFVDFIYGVYDEKKSFPMFDSWREVVNLAGLIDFADIKLNERSAPYWEKTDIINVIENVPVKEYLDFLKEISIIFDDEIPVDIIGKTARYINGYIDLSSLTPEFIFLLINSIRNVKLDVLADIIRNVLNKKAATEEKLLTVGPVMNSLDIFSEGNSFLIAKVIKMKSNRVFVVRTSLDSDNFDEFITTQTTGLPANFPRLGNMRPPPRIPGKTFRISRNRFELHFNTPPALKVEDVILAHLQSSPEIDETDPYKVATVLNYVKL